MRGLALRPASPVEPFLDLLPELDMLLVMTVEPGFGGQAFIEGTLPKVRRARDAITRAGTGTWLQVDGGVSRATIARIAQAGADVFVAGSAVYGADDVAAEIAALRDAGVHDPGVTWALARSVSGTVASSEKDMTHVVSAVHVLRGR